VEAAAAASTTLKLACPLSFFFSVMTDLPADGCTLSLDRLRSNCSTHHGSMRLKQYEMSVKERRSNGLWTGKGNNSEKEGVCFLLSCRISINTNDIVVIKSSRNRSMATAATRANRQQNGIGGECAIQAQPLLREQTGNRMA
jgi:hypothetical protein